MIRPEALSNPSKALPISNFHTNLALMRNPLMAAILQSIQQQQQEQQGKAQILQGLGYSQNPNPMGMIPRGHGILTYEGQALTRPGGSPANIQQLLQTLLGVRSVPSASGFKNRVFSLDKQSSIPGSGSVDQTRLQEAQQLHQNARTLDEVQELYHLYPMEMEYLLGGGK